WTTFPRTPAGGARLGGSQYRGYAKNAYPRLIYPHASGVRFGNLKVVVPDSTVRRLFVAELGFLLDRDHDRRLGRRELESLPAPVVRSGRGRLRRCNPLCRAMQ